MHFRMLLLGLLPGLDSKRRVALLAADSLSMRACLGCGPHESTPDHATLSRTCRLLPIKVQEQVFSWCLDLLRQQGLADGTQIAVDATTLQANMSLQQLRHQESEQGCRALLRSLAKASGQQIENEEDVTRCDRRRKGQQLSNADWESKSDPAARVGKLTHGRTRRACQAEQAVDLDSGVLVGVTMPGADLAACGRSLARSERVEIASTASRIGTPWSPNDGLWAVSRHEFPVALDLRHGLLGNTTTLPQTSVAVKEAHGEAPGRGSG